MLPSIKDFDLKGKRVLIRADFNVPINNGTITDKTRIIESLPTIRYALRQNAAIILVSHLGRPKIGEDNKNLSLNILCEVLQQELKQNVKFIDEKWIDGFNIKPGEIILCENVRFFPGETKNDLDLAKKMAGLCDVFIMDAFGCAHRAHASTEGIAHFVKEKGAGFLLEKEVSSLKKFLKNPNHPVLAIVAGSKVSTKLEVLKSLITVTDFLILGGGIANTFLKAEEFEIGDSLCENELLNVAMDLLSLAKKEKTEILLPNDAVVATEIDKGANAIIKDLNSIESDEKILDIGPKTIERYIDCISKSETILWNGPVGVFEIEQFANGTKKIAQAIAKSRAFSIAGGGDTLAAIERFEVTEAISYVSTGGGAFLEFIEGKDLPGIKVLTI